MPSTTRAFYVCVCLGALISVTALSSIAAVTAFPKDLIGFNAAAGNPPVAVDFDTDAPGTDISGKRMRGITLLAPGAPLIVVRASDTFTPAGFTGTPNPESNKLPATSGENVLSPGGVRLGPGPDANIENDDLTIVFDLPVSAFGFDHLSQSADGFSFSSIIVKDPAGQTLYSATVPISGSGGGSPAGADFWGIVSTAANIKTVLINEKDGDASYPDCNIGFDTLRYVVPQVPLGISNHALRHPIMASAAPDFRFAVWGRVTILDAQSLLLDDGSGAPVKVIAPGHSGVATGDMARASGEVSISGDHPSVLAASADVKKLN